MRRRWSSVLNCQAKIPSYKTKSSAEGEVEGIGELRGAKGCVDIRITYKRSGPADGSVVLQSHRDLRVALSGIPREILG